jgi:tetratricopeptide (TPR) repeat protein
LGEEHEDVAASLNNLAELLRAQGKYDEAKPLYHQSLAIRRKVCAIHFAASSRDHSCKVLGEEHPEVASALNNLAGLLEAQGKYDEVEPLHQQSLAIWRKVCAIHFAASSRDHSCKVLGEEHPSVAASLNNLAGLLESQGKYDEAEPLYRQSLAIHRKVSGLIYACLFHRTSCQFYGDEHLAVATDLNNLAGLLKAQGKCDKAEPLYQQSLAIKRKVCAIHFAVLSHNHSCKVLGEEHTSVATSLNNLAALLNAQGKYDESIPLLRQSLGIMRKVLGEEHPNVATLLNNLAELLSAQRKYGEALELRYQCLAIAKRCLGEEHPQYAGWLNNLAVLLWNTGRSEEAYMYGRQVLAIVTRALGPSHPTTQQYRRDWA